MPTARTDDIGTYYRTEGSGPPVVFVHGMLMDHTMWNAQVEALDDAYTTVAYDVRGHGRTGGSERTPYSIELFAADLEALLDALGIERAVVCGLSMGGAVAQAFAAAHPERVCGLVLADTFHAGPQPLAGRLAATNLRVLGRLDRFVGYKSLNRWQLRVGNWLLPGVAGDGTTVQRLVEKTPTIPHDEVVKIADAVARFPGTELDLSVVTAPALVLHGEHVPSAVETGAKRLVAQLPNADPTVEVVPDAGHASNLDNPEFFAAALRTFLVERLSSDGEEWAAPAEDR